MAVRGMTLVRSDDKRGSQPVRLVHAKLNKAKSCRTELPLTATVPTGELPFESRSRAEPVHASSLPCFRLSESPRFSQSGQLALVTGSYIHDSAQEKRKISPQAIH